MLRKAAYDLLSNEEREFVDAVLRDIDVFKNPSSVEIMDVVFIEGDDTIESFWVVKVSAQNGFGATSSEIYTLSKTIGFYSNEYITTMPVSFGQSYRLNLINEAIADKR